MPRNFRRDDGPIGMDDPDKVVSPDFLREIQENVRAMGEKIRRLEGRQGQVFDPAPPPIVPTLEEGHGIRLEKSARRIRISARLTGEAAAEEEPAGYEFYRANGNRFHVTEEQAMAGYDPETHDNWSLQFGVTNSSLDGYETTGTPPVMSNPIGTHVVNESGSTELLHDADANAVDGMGDPDPQAQTYCRLPIIRDGKRVSFGGAYRENHMIDGIRGPVAELIGK